MSSICVKQSQTQITAAELRAISLCDSDLFLHNYQANHRKLSDCSHSPAISYYSGTESQQSISDKSVYDNVDMESHTNSKVIVSKSPKFLLPQMATLKNSLVNRSKSFQEPGQYRKHLSPRPNIPLRRNLPELSFEDRIETVSNRSSVSPAGSTQSEANDDGSVIQAISTDVQSLKLIQPPCSCDKKSNGPFYIKILRRMQKLSLQWRKCKKVSRGT